MNPERFPGEPLIERLTLAEREEIQACYVRRWIAQKRRDRYEATHKAPAKKYDLNGEARRLTFGSADAGTCVARRAR